MLRNFILLYSLILVDSSNDGYWNVFELSLPSEALQICKVGTRQSPLNIPTSGNIPVKYESLSFKHYDSITSRILSNTGHTVKMEVESDKKSPMLSGGGLGSNYVFTQLHFHWGSQDTSGSEHLLNNKSFPLELHMIHYNKKYGNLLRAAIVNGNDSYDTLAVLGILFQLQEKDNEALNVIIQGLDAVKKEGTEEKLEAFSLINLLPSNKNEFYRYSGSLTTPPCNEFVIWTVFKNYVGVSHSQLAKFRSLISHDDHSPLADNFRETQLQHGREIFENSGSWSLTSSVKVLTLLLVFSVACEILA